MFLYPIDQQMINPCFLCYSRSVRLQALYLRMCRLVFVLCRTCKERVHGEQVFKIYFVFSLDFIKFNDIVSSGQRPVASGTRGKSADQRRPYYLIKTGAVHLRVFIFRSISAKSDCIYSTVIIECFIN